MMNGNGVMVPSNAGLFSSDVLSWFARITGTCLMHPTS